MYRDILCDRRKAVLLWEIFREHNIYASLLPECSLSEISSLFHLCSLFSDLKKAFNGGYKSLRQIKEWLSEKYEQQPTRTKEEEEVYKKSM